jgi:RNA polymerase sigma-70 factor (family 1)
MTPKSLPHESDLLQKIARRDEKAFAAIYNFYSKKVYQYSFRILESKEIAQEVMQELMLKIWLMGDELLKIKDLHNYLRTASSNRSLTILNRAALEKKAHTAFAIRYSQNNNSTEEQLLLKTLKSILDDAISKLPDHQRKVYILCHQEGLQYEEVATHTGLSIETVKTYMKYALRFLRSYVARHTDKATVLVVMCLFKLF